MRQLPYNTGKVQIGLLYDPPRPSYGFTLDEDRLQRALLNVRPVINSDMIVTAISFVALLIIGILWVTK